jgi:hypothetical protein
MEGFGSLLSGMAKVRRMKTDLRYASPEVLAILAVAALVSAAITLLVWLTQ